MNRFFFFFFLGGVICAAFIHTCHRYLDWHFVCTRLPYLPIEVDILN